MVQQQPKHWQLPRGVSRSLWDYAHSRTIADDYDNYFLFNRLFDLDEQVVLRHFQVGTNKVVADLGCGTGRALVPLVRRGLRGIAVDLSADMLRIVREKASAESLPITCVQANLAELDGLAGESVDYAMCLFSTLGMIAGTEHRQLAVKHFARMLRPRGILVLHVHNVWFNLHDPGGPWWLMASWLRSLTSSDFEFGDKYFPYRGIPRMYLHVFRKRELSRLLRRAGLRIVTWHWLNATRGQFLQHPWWFGSIRASGWIVVAEKAP
ncbi:MAG: methyltransferase domain-containing protein [Pirellulaceae bacterium]